MYFKTTIETHEWCTVCEKMIVWHGGVVDRPKLTVVVVAVYCGKQRTGFLPSSSSQRTSSELGQPSVRRA